MGRLEAPLPSRGLDAVRRLLASRGCVSLAEAAAWARLTPSEVAALARRLEAQGEAVLVGGRLCAAEGGRGGGDRVRYVAVGSGVVLLVYRCRGELYRCAREAARRARRLAEAGCRELGPRVSAACRYVVPVVARGKGGSVRLVEGVVVAGEEALRLLERGAGLPSGARRYPARGTST